MTEHELVKELGRLQNGPTTKEDWRDLYETIQAYERRCLARAIARSPNREELLATIKELALLGGGPHTKEETNGDDHEA